MLLGKRPRPQIRRTTSMTEFVLDLAAPEAGPPSPPAATHQQQSDRQRPPTPLVKDEDMMVDVSRYVAAVATPRSIGARRYSVDIDAIDTAQFLQACGLCNRRLGPGRDTFMYRGEVAFCSLECRQQQMSLDERKEKCSLGSMKKVAPPATTAVSETSNGGGETVAVA